MDASVWAALPQKRKKQFGSATQFCVQRLMRLAVDRLEAAQRQAPLSLTFEPERDPPRSARRSVTIPQTCMIDSRAATRVASVNFSDPRQHCQLQAAILLLCMAHKEFWQHVADKAQEPSWLRALVACPAPGGETVREYWTKAHAERFLASVEWDFPDEQIARGRRRLRIGTRN